VGPVLTSLLIILNCHVNTQNNNGQEIVLTHTHARARTENKKSSAVLNKNFIIVFNNLFIKCQPRFRVEGNCFQHLL